MSGGFHGFTPEAGEFLMELRFNNERPWFQANRDRFERAVNVPFRALASETLALMRAQYPQDDFQVHAARIYRDARRLFGRGPYKDHLWFTLQRGVAKAVGPVFWFSIEPFSWSWGVGSWQSSPRCAEIYRRMIDEDPESFRAIVRDVEKLEGRELYGDMYKRPKAERGDLNEWYNRRRVSVSFDRDLGGVLYEETLPQFLAQRYGELMELYRFLRRVYEQSVIEEQTEEQKALFGE